MPYLRVTHYPSNLTLLIRLSDETALRRHRRQLSSQSLHAGISASCNSGNSGNYVSIFLVFALTIARSRRSESKYDLADLRVYDPTHSPALVQTRRGGPARETDLKRHFPTSLTPIHVHSTEIQRVFPRYSLLDWGHWEAGPPRWGPLGGRVVRGGLKLATCRVGCPAPGGCDAVINLISSSVGGISASLRCFYNMRTPL